jgi:hypothetical protein
MVLSHSRMFSVGSKPGGRLPVAFSWVLIAFLVAFLGWQYFSHPKPGPYGVCYPNKGRNACPPDLSKAGSEKDLKLTAQH